MFPSVIRDPLRGWEKSLTVLHQIHTNDSVRMPDLVNGVLRTNH